MAKHATTERQNDYAMASSLAVCNTCILGESTALTEWPMSMDRRD